ncbi:YegP family protein [Streptacidiphilus rugosus]|uniref:YegP family protein n=1 Tax=Streptacidiphilus rugosus TaxID=405783 RepID=UPI00055C6F91|nr:DUF1508 domain-containing protein [Streptacidiphilus rugosus]
MTSTFEVYIDNSGEWRFRLTGLRGETIVASKAFTSQLDCLAGVAAMQTSATEAQITVLVPSVL